jgi:hypothetical protein
MVPKELTTDRLFLRQWRDEDVDALHFGRIGLFCHHDWPLADRPVPEVGWVLHATSGESALRPREARRASRSGASSFPTSRG